MRQKHFLILTLTVLLICCCIPATADTGTETVIVPGEEWSWSRGAYNTFSGQIDLSDCTGRELTIRISSDLQYNSETEQLSMPVFTSVNGKRIVMTKQCDTVHISAEGGRSAMEYSCSVRLPEKQHVSSVTFLFQVTDEDGNDLKTVSGRIESAENGTAATNSPFYFSIDINRITVILLIASALVWMLVLARNLRQKKKKQENKQNADL